MRQSTHIVHVSHKLLLVALLLVAFCVPFIMARSHDSSLSNTALMAGSGVLGNGQAMQSSGKQQVLLGATVTSAAGQSLVNPTAK